MFIKLYIIYKIKYIIKNIINYIKYIHIVLYKIYVIIYSCRRNHIYIQYHSELN